jgi:hypothetical protein
MVLVGYACPEHSSYSIDTGIPRGYYDDVALAILDIIPPPELGASDDESDDEGSIFSSMITLSRATSFVSTGDDTIQEILHVFLDDPLLRWDKLVGCWRTSRTFSEVKDVRFFLRAFEIALRDKADSTLEHHTCAFLRSRIPYISSQICDRFGLLDDVDNKPSDRPASLQPITIDEPDPTLMPSFAKVRHFLFDGSQFQALKDNIKNFSQNTRDHCGEMADILIKNLHRPEKILETSFAEDSLRTQLDTFLSALANEAALAKVSAYDRAGIKSLQGDVHLHALTREVWSAWTHDVPVWHTYPPVISSIGCTLSEGSVGFLEYNLDCENFEAFTCSSRSFLDLARCLSGLRGTEKPSENSLPISSAQRSSINARPFASESRSKDKLKFECVGLSRVRG